eukprot:185027_1
MGQTVGYYLSPQTYKPAPFIAAILLYRSFNDTHKHGQPWITENMQKLIEIIDRKISTAQIELKVSLMNMDKDHNYNIYLNICNKPDLRQELNAVLSLNNIILDSFSLTTNLVPQIMETSRTFCEECFTTLKRNHTFNKNSQNKGTIGVLYDVYDGPIITMHYTHKCQDKNCKSFYLYGRYIINGSYYLEAPDQCVQMNTKATFFRDNVINEFHEYSVKNIGAEYYAEIYNEKWKEKIAQISDYLQATKQTLGLRKYDCSMQPANLLAAFSFRQMHKAVHEDMKRPVIIPSEIVDKYKKMKQEKKIVKKNGEIKQSNNTWISCNDIKSIMFSMYGKYLRTSGLEWMKYVPIKDGKVHPLHFLIIGDLGAKITIPICGYPMSWYQKDNEHLHENNVLFKQMRCLKDPQRGNDDSISFKTCPCHTSRLIDLGCEPTKINELCKYIKITEKSTKYINRATVEQKQNETTQTKKFESKLSKFKQSDINIFQSIQSKVMNNTRIRRSNYNQTRANMNESQQYINDEAKLNELEYISRQDNVDPVILNDIKLLEILEEERNNPNAWDNLEGCRKGRHVFEDKYQHKPKAEPLYERTAGLLGCKSQDNFILYLEEELYRETPTGCIIATTTFLTSNAITIAFAERINGWGWDMMCCLYPRIRTLILNDLLPPLQITLLISTLEYLYVDTFHVTTHVNKLCQKIGGLFHPYLRKFKGILYGLTVKNNDPTQEQEWRDTNRIRFAKNLKRSNSAIFWYAYRKRHNKRNIANLRKKGYSFRPISQVSKVR